MYTEARKINLIGAVLNVTNESTLIELESVLKKSKVKKEKQRKQLLSAHDFLGKWSKKDAALIEKAIKQSCEHIHGDDWK